MYSPPRIAMYSYIRVLFKPSLDGPQTGFGRDYSLFSSINKNALKAADVQPNQSFANNILAGEEECQSVVISARLLQYGRCGLVGCMFTASSDEQVAPSPHCMLTNTILYSLYFIVYTLYFILYTLYFLLNQGLRRHQHNFAHLFQRL